MGVVASIGKIITKVLKDSGGAVKAIGRDLAESKGTQAAIKEIATETQEEAIKTAAKIAPEELSSLLYKNVEKAISDKAGIQARNISDMVVKSYKKDGAIGPRMQSRLEGLFGPDEAAKLIADPKTFKGDKLRKAIKGEYTHKEYIMANNKMEAEVRSLYGTSMPRIEAELGKAGSGVAGEIQKSNVLYKHLISAKKTLGLDEKVSRNVLQGLSDELKTMSHKADYMFTHFSSKGYKPGIEAARDWRKFLDGQQGVSSKMRSLGLEITNKMKGMGETRSRAVREYIERGSEYQLVDNAAVDGMVFGKGFMKDVKAADSIALEKGYALTDIDVREANKIQNALRQMKKVEHNIDNRNYDQSWFTGQLDNLGDDGGSLLQHLDDNFSTSSVGDFGHQYFPAVGNEAHRDLVKASKIENVIKDEYNPALQHWKGRMENSKLRAEPDAYRMLPHEEMGIYMMKMENSIGKHTGDRLINDLAVHATVFSPLGAAPESVYKNIPKLKDLKQQWENVHAIREKAPDNWIYKGAEIAVEVNKAAALASPRMAGVNMFQPLTNNITKPTVEVLASMLRGTSLIVDTVFSKGNISKSISKGINRNPSSLSSRVRQQYFFDYKNSLSTATLDMGAVGGKLRKGLDMLTKLYQMTDTWTRSIALDASVNHLEKTYARHLHLKKEPVKFMEKMTKDLHLDTFGAIDKHELTNKLMGEVDDLAYEYAKRATEIEIFDYSKFGRPQILDRAKKNPILANALALTSWPMYYTQVLGGALQSMKDGNRDPLIGMLGVGALWMTAANKLKDDKDTESFGRYMSMRQPVINPLAFFAEASERSFGGIIQPTMDIMTTPFYAVMAEATSIGNNSKDHWHYALQDRKKRMKYMPIASRARDMLDVRDLFIDLYEENK